MRDRYYRARRRAGFALRGVPFGLVGTLMLTETVEVFCGVPHRPGLAYAVSGGFALWAFLEVRHLLRHPRPGFPGSKPSDPDPDPPPPPLPPDFPVTMDLLRNLARVRVDAE